jgi:rhamnosyltransferase
MQNPEITVIIRTYNEAANIERCLAAVLAQDCSRTVEVLVVDSGSSDDTVAIARTYPVRVVAMQQHEFSFGCAMNLGCSYAEGTIIVSLSGDATPQGSSWLQSLVAPLDAPEIAAVYGKEVPYENCDPVTARIIASVFTDDRKREKKESFFTNSNSAFRKKVWQESAFDEQLAAAEDHSWARDVARKGYIICYEPHAVVWHSHLFTHATLYARYVKELSVLYTVINALSPLQIGIKGCLNCVYGIAADIVFVIKSKRPLREIAQSILFELIILRAHIQVAQQS